MRGDANDTQGPSRILIAAALLVAIVPFYRWSWNTAPPDMAEFLVPWFRHIVAAGRLEAFSAPFSNYSPPYLYLLALSSWLDGLAAAETIIRLLSLLIAGALGVALWRLVRGPALIAVLPFAVPSVIVNAALLGQCDALWAAPCLLAVAAAVRRSPGWMLAWCGVAFAVKAQAAFLAPFALGALLAMQPRPHHWLVAPATYLACMVPALIMGWPIAHILTIYLQQSGEFAGQISVGAANPWMMLTYAGWQSPALIPPAYALAFLVALGSSWAVWRRLGSAGPTDIIALALLPALALPYALPMMHERYFFLADILAIAFALKARDRESVIVALLVQAGSTLSLFAYITGETVQHLEQLPGRGVPVLGIAAFLAFTAALGLLIRRSVRLASGDDAARCLPSRTPGSSSPRSPVPAPHWQWRHRREKSLPHSG